MRLAFVLFALVVSTHAFAQTDPSQAGANPGVKSKSEVRATNKVVLDNLRTCLEIDDMTKERLDCIDAILAPAPKPKAPRAKVIAECRFLAEEDERLKCFDRFLEPPQRPKPVSRTKTGSASAVPSQEPTTPKNR